MKTQALTMISTIGLTALVVYAEPTLYPKHMGVLSGIINNTNSNILADEMDPKTIWVLPPNSARAQVTGLNKKTAFMGYCAEMGDLKDYSRDLSHQIKTLNDKRTSQEESLRGLRSRADALREEAESFAAQKNMMALIELEDRIKEADLRLMELYVTAEKCQQSCELLQDDIRNTVLAKKEMLKQRNELAKQHAADIRNYERKTKAADAAEKTYHNARKVFSEFIKDVSDVQKSFRETFEWFGEKEGANATFLYSSDWNSNVAKLRAENSGINFSKVATKNALLSADISGVDNIDTTTAIKTIGIAGGLNNGSGSVRLTSYPEDLSVNVVLSLIGACPMEHPEYFDITNNDPVNMNYGIFITYDYESIFTAKAMASYNMYKMYQKIVESGSSGGLFSSRSWSYVTERNFFRDSFNVTWDDRENSIPEEKKLELESEMRRNVMQRLANIALPLTPDKAGVVAAAAPPLRGVVVVADSLRTACPLNIYCQGGSLVLNILDSIFGSRGSASYTNIIDATVEDNYAKTQKITKPWITSYLTKKD